MYLLLLAGIILGLSFYLDKKQGDEYKVYIPYIGFVNTRLWGSIITTLLILFVINN
ncbi:TMhelix containing protein [Vibrio phage 1.187.O._10N.286.49.F1]|nr:TMhelix containing protein [Vibrio phage 1.187.O._10N.286.49.F1]